MKSAKIFSASPTNPVRNPIRKVHPVGNPIGNPIGYLLERKPTKFSRLRRNILCATLLNPVTNLTLLDTPSGTLLGDF